MQLLNNHAYRPTEAVIRENEEYRGVALPDELRRLLLEYNGGIPANTLASGRSEHQAAKGDPRGKTRRMIR